MVVVHSDLLFQELEGCAVGDYLLFYEMVFDGGVLLLYFFVPLALVFVHDGEGEAAFLLVLVLLGFGEAFDFEEAAAVELVDLFGGEFGEGEQDEGEEGEEYLHGVWIICIINILSLITI